MSAVFESVSTYSCASISSFADAARHAAHCRPGLWKICTILDADLAAMLGAAQLNWIDAVIDDFGNLVRVPSPPAAPPRRFAVTVRTPDGFVETYLRVGGTSCDHSQEAMDRAGIGGRVTVHEVREGA